MLSRNFSVRSSAHLFRLAATRASSQGCGGEALLVAARCTQLYYIYVYCAQYYNIIYILYICIMIYIYIYKVVAERLFSWQPDVHNYTMYVLYIIIYILYTCIIIYIRVCGKEALLVAAKCT